MDSINGCIVTIPVEYDERCDYCGGTGAKTPQDIETCPTCGGTGQVNKRVQSFLGTIEQRTVCPDCHGTGKHVKNKCPHCNGNGYTHVKPKLKSIFLLVLATDNKSVFLDAVDAVSMVAKMAIYMLKLLLMNHKYSKEKEMISTYLFLFL